MTEIHRRGAQGDNNFEFLFSFFTQSATVGGGEPSPRQNRRLSRYCHDTCHIFFPNKVHTHYTYCHLCVCCSVLVTVIKSLVSLGGESNE